MKGHVALVTVVKKGSWNGSVPASPVAALRSRNVTSGVSQGRAWALGSGLHGTQAYLLKQTNNTFPTKGKRKAKDLVALEVRKLSFSLCVALGLFWKRC